MPSYRSGGPCEFCDDPADASCTRCACPTCPKHAGTPYCVLCQKEARDEADVARFQSEVLAPERQTGYFSGPGNTTPLGRTLVAWLGRLVYGGKREAASIPFARRTPEDIRAWRRTAGVPTRD